MHWWQGLPCRVPTRPSEGTNHSHTNGAAIRSNSALSILPKDTLTWGVEEARNQTADPPNSGRHAPPPEPQPPWQHQKRHESCDTLAIRKQRLIAGYIRKPERLKTAFFCEWAEKSAEGGCRCSINKPHTAQIPVLSFEHCHLFSKWNSN